MEKLGSFGKRMVAHAEWGTALVTIILVSMIAGGVALAFGRM